MTEKLLTTKKVAEILGISPLTVEGWRRTGRGPPFTQVGRGIRYREAGLRKWIAENTRERTLVRDRPLPRTLPSSDLISEVRRGSQGARAEAARGLGGRTTSLRAGADHNMAPAPLLTEKAAAAYLGVTPKTMQDWRIRPKRKRSYGFVPPPYIRLGARQIRYRQEALDEWLEERTAKDDER